MVDGLFTTLSQGFLFRHFDSSPLFHECRSLAAFLGVDSDN